VPAQRVTWARAVGLGDVRKSRPLNAPPARGMPPKVLVGTAGRAARRQHTQASELNVDTSGASVALAAALRLVATVAVEMRKIRKDSGEQTVCGYTVRRRMSASVVKLFFFVKTVCAKEVRYGSVHALAAAEIRREQAARTIGELQSEGIELRSYRAMPTDGSRPPSLLQRRPDASVVAAAHAFAAPAAALYAVAACCDPKVTVVVVEHEAGKGPTDQSDLRKSMSDCAVGGVEWRKRDPGGKFSWVLQSMGEGGTSTHCLV
jgi:hypothetical protein